MAVRLATDPIGGSNDDLHELGGGTPLQTCLTEARAAGFTGIELRHKFPRDGRRCAWGRTGEFLQAPSPMWFVLDPQSQAAEPAQPRYIRRPVLHLELHLRDVVTAIDVVLARNGRRTPEQKRRTFTLPTPRATMEVHQRRPRLLSA